MLRSRLVPAGAAALALSLLIVGCSSDDEPSTKKSDDKDPTVATTDGEWSVAGALAEVPDAAAAERAFVQTGDLVAAIDAAGLERSDDGDVFEWLLPITGITPPDEEPSPVFVPVPELMGSYARITEPRLRELVGIGFNDVDGFVTQTSPPTDLTVLSGEGIGPDGLSDDLVEHDGVHSDIEGEDLALDLSQRDVTLSQLGRPTRITARTGAVALSSVTAIAKDWRGEGTTLADRNSLAAVAAELDEHDVYSAVLTEVEPGGDPALSALGPNVTPEQLEAYRERTGAHLIEGSFDAVAIGWAVEDGKARLHVAYHFKDDETAADAKDSLTTAWTELPTQAGMPISEHVTVRETTVDGPVAAVSLDLVDEEHPAIVLKFLQQQEPVFASR